jgi:hypothetical protein
MQTIVAAARRLFSEQGFFAAKAVILLPRLG